VASDTVTLNSEPRGINVVNVEYPPGGQMSYPPARKNNNLEDEHPDSSVPIVLARKGVSAKMDDDEPPIIVSVSPVVSDAELDDSKSGQAKPKDVSGRYAPYIPFVDPETVDSSAGNDSLRSESLSPSINSINQNAVDDDIGKATLTRSK
jgi:hypothetical protein